MRERPRRRTAATSAFLAAILAATPFFPVAGGEGFLAPGASAGTVEAARAGVRAHRAVAVAPERAAARIGTLSMFPPAWEGAGAIRITRTLVPTECGNAGAALAAQPGPTGAASASVLGLRAARTAWAAVPLRDGPCLDALAAALRSCAVRSDAMVVPEISTVRSAALFMTWRNGGGGLSHRYRGVTVPLVPSLRAERRGRDGLRKRRTRCGRSRATPPRPTFFSACNLGRRLPQFSTPSARENVAGPSAMKSSAESSVEASMKPSAEASPETAGGPVAVPFPETGVTALACDRRGRVWAGHLRRGVSVWNGAAWKTYGPGADAGENGPLGRRVFALKVHPLDGDVWLATEAGLTRYRAARDRWEDFTPAEGLAAHAVVALAFDPATGDAWIGYDAHGVGRAARDEHGEYPRWEHFRAPASFPAVGAQPELPSSFSSNAPPARSWPLPNTPTGTGLPSDFVNDLAVDRDGTVWAATHTGLAWSRDRGASWRFLRGRDWEARVKGLHRPPAPQWTCRRQDLWMPEDHVRRLAVDEGGGGVIWAGFRRYGWQAFRPSAEGPAPIHRPEGAAALDYATALLPTPEGWLAAGYGKGLRLLRAPRASGTAAPSASAVGIHENNEVGEIKATDEIKEAVKIGVSHGTGGRDGKDGDVAAEASARGFPPHPAPGAAPTAGDIARLVRTLRAVPADPDPPAVVALPDDWATRGDWLGRRGTYRAVLCALQAPYNYLWGAGEKPVRYRHFIGPHRRAGDDVRHWVQWLYTGDPRSLEMPPAYLDSRRKKGFAPPGQPRRQSEWDDHSETYPPSWDGPHLYCSLRIPEGDFILSLYNFNKDGLVGPNRFRDYPIHLKALPEGRAMTDVTDWDERPELGRGRFHDFRGGVWKRWRVRGPRDLTVRLSRNGGHSTILAGVMLDGISAFPDPYFDAEERARLEGAASPARPTIPDRIHENIGGAVADPDHANAEDRRRGNAAHSADGNGAGKTHGDLAGTGESNGRGNVAGNVEGDTKGDIEGSVGENIGGDVEGNAEGDIEGNVGRNTDGNAEGSDRESQAVHAATIAVLAELERLRREHPREWASRQTRTLTLTARFLEAAAPPRSEEGKTERKILRARLAHALNRFETCEATLRALHLRPPRDREKAIRRDNTAPTHSRQNRKLLANDLSHQEFPDQEPLDGERLDGTPFPRTVRHHDQSTDDAPDEDPPHDEGQNQAAYRAFSINRIVASGEEKGRARRLL